MHAEKVDRSLQNTLEWAMDRMRNKGYVVNSPVVLSVDPNLSIMGYAKKEGESHRIVISEWALDSEMLGGLVLHELAHIYFTERGAHSHDGEMLEEILQGLKEKDGLRAKETEYLIDAFNHLQNILVDDVVFAVMDEKELEMAKRFFSEWVAEKPSGDPVLDSALLSRNAFAIASLKRRKILDGQSDMAYRNKGFVVALGQHAEADFEWLEGFLENARSDWGKKQLQEAIEEYFDKILSLMRSSSRLDDLR
ncbi:MAG: DUF5781 family protein [Thaumarchaeota archaeon]|nr:DUF5781 family protein [Nitrososphaerota archaeon]